VNVAQAIAFWVCRWSGTAGQRYKRSAHPEDSRIRRVKGSRDYTSENKKELWEVLRLSLCESSSDPSNRSVVEMSAGRMLHQSVCKPNFPQVGAGRRVRLAAITEYRNLHFLRNKHRERHPSKVIDQVWHEHQLSQSYREFCSEVIDKEFDHTPE